jgi:trinucleotide repeat-containing gene 6 protein
MEEQMLTVSVLLAGLNPNMNVNSIDMSSGLSVKDPSQSQSRLPQWTHPNSMGNLSSAASPLDQNPSKHGTYARAKCPPTEGSTSLIDGVASLKYHFSFCAFL